MSDQSASATVFKVDDMTCSHCAGAIRNALREGIPGVAFTIDMEQQRVTVEGDAGVAAGILRDAGYEAVLLAG